MSDSKNVPKPPPPDDFSKTTPNIKAPKKDDGGSYDWEKTSYNYPPQPPSEDWGKTVANFKAPSSSDEPDFNKTYMPSNQPKSSDEWGITQANINLPADFGTKPEDFEGQGANTNFTTPLIRLPEAELAKYQNLPPTPAEEIARQKEEEANQTGVPNWVWISGGLMTMFFFTIFILIGAWFFFSRDTDFNVALKGAPPQSDVLVDKIHWGFTRDDGSIFLTGLTANETKRIEVVHPSYNCEPIDVKGESGIDQEKIARCSTKPVKPGEDCSNIKTGEFEKAERCANDALNKLPDPPPIDDLLAALNLFIINFESGKYNIPPPRMAFLKRASEYIQKLPPSSVIEIGGHTDSEGSDASNQTLSENRANAVRAALLKFGVKEEMLQTKGYGESKPKATNETVDGKFQNRRIEYTAVKK